MKKKARPVQGIIETFIFDLSLSLLVTIKRFQKLLYVRFSCLLEKSTAAAGARMGLETALCFEVSSDFRFDIAKIQQITLG